MKDKMINPDQKVMANPKHDETYSRRQFLKKLMAVIPTALLGACNWPTSPEATNAQHQFETSFPPGTKFHYLNSQEFESFSLDEHNFFGAASLQIDQQQILLLYTGPQEETEGFQQYLMSNQAMSSLSFMLSSTETNSVSRLTDNSNPGSIVYIFVPKQSNFRQSVELANQIITIQPVTINRHPQLGIAVQEQEQPIHP